jgi:hypothetical protein
MGIPLRVLRPKWLADPGREQMGIELDCPRHPDAERVQVWFINPGDGGAPAPDDGRQMLHMASDSEDGLEGLTLLPFGGAAYRPIRVGHWFGWLIEGELNECRVMSVN